MAMTNMFTFFTALSARPVDTSARKYQIHPVGSFSLISKFITLLATIADRNAIVVNGFIRMIRRAD
ncbi:hypothetical protein PT279_00250 [Bifidobacterium sp. ESL0784]|uniref:hypothetical protein n=1 Tax=Bifidobacterium sp. ESL0784 TaxID=2983231 RepID=UPI0023F7BAD8|nr:hypothetical protein [Bifidobacterium sp. ESL0784]MDF7640038.1 hypothetical protein [Bifidobacterium sp. ESL0784]